MKKHHKIFCLTTLILLTFNTLIASIIKGAEEVTISAPIEGNLYVAGGKVFINAQIFGDLLAAGGEITVSDSIKKDGHIAGGKLKLQAPVGEDLRIAGGDISIENSIGGDLVVAGGNVVIGRNVVIYGDLVVGGGSVEMNGSVKGNVNAGAGELKFNGTAGGEFVVKVVELHLNGEIRGLSKLSAQELFLGKNARFYSDVAYWQRAGKIDFTTNMMNGAKAVFDPSLKMKDGEFDWRTFGQGMVLFWLWQLVAYGLMVALLIWVFPRFFAGTVDNYYQKYLNKFGYGVLYLIAMPVVAVMLLVTVIGIPMGILAFSIYGLSIAFANVLTAVVAMFELQRKLGKTWTRGQQILVGIGLYALIKLVVLIPLIGILASFIVVSIAFGAVLMRIFKKEKPMEALV